jgi:hypothetical protein
MAVFLETRAREKPGISKDARQPPSLLIGIAVLSA